MLDLGANVQCDADNLRAVRGDGQRLRAHRAGRARADGRLAQCRLGGDEGPRRRCKAAHGILRQATGLPGKFIGFVEGDDITRGTVDVIVTDGFTGNIALKSIEGAVKLYSHFLRQTFKSSWMAGLGYLLARPAMNALRARVDPRRYNGAIFMGLNGVPREESWRHRCVRFR